MAPDICGCSGWPCYWRKLITVTCCGMSIAKIVGPSCSDSEGVCATYSTRDVSCNDGYGTYCVEDIIDPCPQGPTPTPTPTPEPTATPTPTPTPTPECDPNRKLNDYCYCQTNAPGGPAWLCPVCPTGPTANFIAYPQTGCPNSAYYGGGGCCKCAVENPTCTTGYVWNTDICDCVPAPTPTPEPTTTPSCPPGQVWI